MIAISVRQTPLADDEWCNDGEPDEEIVSTLPSCPASAGIRNIQINQLNIHPLLISLVTQLYLFLCKVCKVTEVLGFRRWSEEWQFITWQVKLSPLSGVCSSWDKPRWCRPRTPGRWWCTSRPSPWQRRYSCNTFRGCNKGSIILILILCLTCCTPSRWVCWSCWAWRGSPPARSWLRMRRTPWTWRSLSGSRWAVTIIDA